MQISEMRTLRSFYHQKHLLNIKIPKPISPSSLALSKPTQNPQFSRHFRTTDQKPLHPSNKIEESSSNGDNTDPSQNPIGENGYRIEKPRVWSVFDTGFRGIRLDENEEYSNESDIVGEIKEENDLLVDSLNLGLKKINEDSDLSGKKSMKKDDQKSFGKIKEDKKSEEDSDSNTISEGVKEFKKTEWKDNSIVKSRYDGVVMRKKKSKVCWVCSECGYSDGQWWGICKSCGTVGTLKQFSISGDVGNKTSGLDVSENAVQSWLPQHMEEVHPLRLTDVNQGINQSTRRISLSGLVGSEVERVLGGGLVLGSLVLIGGDPGVGKSTLVLQIAAMMADGRDFRDSAPVVYVSGEESVEQIGIRADRMKIQTKELFLYSSTDIEDILTKIQNLSPRALIIDSIQTVYLAGVAGSAGGITQVKECTSTLLRYAKSTNVPVLLIGHVTKTGDIAGPRVLEHIVDVVLYMEGEKYSTHRLLRSVKNRFGSTDELGIFQMSDLGLQAVLNPSEMFLSEEHFDSEFLAGLAVTVIIDGSRPFVLEIQALCVSTMHSRGEVIGVRRSKADMIIAVLTKQAGLKLQDHAIFINVVSGITMDETAGDLAIAAAICSSFLEFPIPNSIAFIGEVGLGGELRAVPRMDKRLNTIAKLGYKKCVVPKSTQKNLGNLKYEGLKIVGCQNLKEVINAVFRAGD